jgi:hypothetical protein
VKPWSLTTFGEKLIKIGAKVMSHAKVVMFQLAEVAVPRSVFAAILERIDQLRAILVRVEQRGRPEEVTRRPT